MPLHKKLAQKKEHKKKDFQNSKEIKRKGLKKRFQQKTSNKLLENKARDPNILIPANITNNNKIYLHMIKQQ